MALSGYSTFYNLDMETITAPVDVTTDSIAVGPDTFSDNDAIFTPRLDVAGRKYLEVSIPDGKSAWSVSGSDQHAGVQQGTFVLVSRIPSAHTPEEGRETSTLTYHPPSHTTLLVREPGGVSLAASSSLSSEPSFWVPYGQVHVFVVVLRNSGTNVFAYVDGKLSDENLENSPYFPVDYYTVLPAGDIYRFAGISGSLTDEEVESLSADLLDEYLYSDVTVEWEPPEHNGGAPITGYIIRTPGVQGVDEFRAEADATELTFRSIGGPVQVVAENAAGRSLPAEVTS